MLNEREMANGDLARLELLIIESNAADARLTIEALKYAGFDRPVTVVQDGECALRYLRREGEFSEARIPDVIFLDLSLPRMSGLELLRAIRIDPALSCIPVVVVSGSRDPADVRKAYELRANCFIAKPGELDQFLQFIRSCYEFWGSVVTLPTAAGTGR